MTVLARCSPEKSVKKIKFGYTTKWLIGIVFANSLGDRGSVPGHVIPKT